MTSDATAKSETTLSSSTLNKTSSIRWRLVFCATGICVSYWFYGFLQEKLITKSRLGATFMLVIQTVVNVLVALLWQTMERQRFFSKTEPKSGDSSTMSLNHPLMALTSAFYVLAMAASNESLRFVSYPVAVLGKSCKMIPTMIMGVLLERRQYSWTQWCAALCISAGIALFHLSRLQESGINNITSIPKVKQKDIDYWKGIILLCLSLAMDGFLGACQGILKRPDSKRFIQRPPTAVETMLFINLYALVLLFPMAIVSGQWDRGLRLLSSNEQLRWSVTILNAVVAIGQIFIFLTITWYSSLVTTTITTTRKFATILLSCAAFGHRFTLGQWVSVILVFGGLYLSIAMSASMGKRQIITKPAIQHQIQLGADGKKKD